MIYLSGMLMHVYVFRLFQPPLQAAIGRRGVTMAPKASAPLTGIDDACGTLSHPSSAQAQTPQAPRHLQTTRIADTIRMWAPCNQDAYTFRVSMIFNLNALFLYEH